MSVRSIKKMLKIDVTAYYLVYDVLRNVCVPVGLTGWAYVIITAAAAFMGGLFRITGSFKIIILNKRL